jgi:hypothetical protein
MGVMIREDIVTDNGLFLLVLLEVLFDNMCKLTIIC